MPPHATQTKQDRLEQLERERPSQKRHYTRPSRPFARTTTLSYTAAVTAALSQAAATANYCVLQSVFLILMEANDVDIC